jgi:hypothetical protein
MRAVRLGAVTDRLAWPGESLADRLDASTMKANAALRRSSADSGETYRVAGHLSM